MNSAATSITGFMGSVRALMGRIRFGRFSLARRGVVGTGMLLMTLTLRSLCVTTLPYSDVNLNGLRFLDVSGYFLYRPTLLLAKIVSRSPLWGYILAIAVHRRLLTVAIVTRSVPGGSVERVRLSSVSSAGARDGTGLSSWTLQVGGGVSGRLVILVVNYAPGSRVWHGRIENFRAAGRIENFRVSRWVSHSASPGVVLI